MKGTMKDTDEPIEEEEAVEEEDLEDLEPTEADLDEAVEAFIAVGKEFAVV